MTQEEPKSDKFLVITQGNAEDVGRTRNILERWSALEREVLAA